MFKNYLQVALRNLVKHKLYSAINIVGLAVGLAACILITLFVRDEFTYDTQWAKAEKIYRLNTTFAIPGREPFITVSAPGPAKQALLDYFGEDILHTARITNMHPVVRYGDRVNEETIVWADSAFAEMIDFPVVSGNIKAALGDNASLVVTEAFAKRIFGTNNPLGEVVSMSFYDTVRDYRVAAVIEDLPHNTIFDIEAMVMIDEQDFKSFPWMFSQWTSVNQYLFFELKDGASIEALHARMPDFVDHYIKLPPAAGIKGKASDLITMTPQRLLDIQLNPHGPVGGEMKPTGSIDNVMLFAAVAALILIIGCINFMNLATAKSTQRAKEVALRKVLGASRPQLVGQFMGESLLLALLGLFFGVVLVELVLPAFGNYVGKTLVLDYTDAANWLLLLGLIVIVGLLGGAYPALVLSGFQPARVLKANKSAETRGSANLRQVLVIAQFAISVSLIICTCLVYGQKFYLMNMDAGFSKDQQLLVHNLGNAGVRDKRDVIKQRIGQLPGVESVALHADPPASGNESNISVRIPGDESQQSQLIGVQSIDHDFFPTYEIPLLAGRNYDINRPADGMPAPESLVPGQKGQGTIIVNESALGKFGFGTPEQALGKVIEVGVDFNPNQPTMVDLTIIGVVPDMHFQSLRRVVRPEIYQLNANNWRTLTVRFSGNGNQLVKDIQEVWRSQVTDEPFRHQFVVDRMAGEFEQESRQSTLLGIFAGLAIVIACLGLYGLAAFTAERRTKEIGIRKVMGARARDIVALMLWQFSKPVLLANVIAWPLASWIMINWLSQFPYRLDSWVLIPVCLVAGALALAIAWLTVGGNAARVAMANPVKALRYE
ncbi:ABC transporter permease [Simiduia sp. 21SJ11W-1]|uniref:ABC transporter permease n=1 Tax=Simiduia sp. 21SJ11W-1 TaxID=2909669 RepID=UPI00209D313E|nr:ABC transporter permease [Simiduia sp. 21SJ11W-1]UTA48450.1 ABC transporter permease [Simiduia sp. 21SJ11W-1]